MIHYRKRLAAGVLALALLFTSGCGTNPENQKESEAPKNVAMGRYIETEYKLPPKTGYVKNIMQLSDGSIEMLCNLDPTKNMGPWHIFTSADDGASWQQTDAPWLAELGNAVGGSVARDGEGNWYLYYMEISAEIQAMIEKGENPPDDYEPAYKFIKVDMAGTITQLSPEFPRGQRSAGVQSIAIAKNGDYIVNGYGSIMQVDPATMKIKNEYVGNTYGDSLTGMPYGDMVLVSDGDEISFYSLATGEKTDGFSMAETTGKETKKPTVAYAGGDSRGHRMFTQAADGSLYICEKTGIYRRVQGGTVLERLVDGEMTSLNMPSLFFNEMVAGENSVTVFFTAGEVTGASGESNKRAMNYSYSATTPTVPEKEMKIYSLYDNKTIRQAIGLFQRANPDVHLIYDVGLSGESITLSDALRTLSTELLAGKGPDVLVLDGMPIDSYIEKGVLLDLAEMLDVKLASGELLANAGGALKRQDGKAYSIPARFSAPVLVADDEVADAMTDLTTFADTHVKLNKEAGDKTKSQYQSPVMAADAGLLMNFFYPISAPAWQNADGSVKEPEFRQFLTDIKKLYDLGDHSEEAANGSNIDLNFDNFGGFSWAFDLIPADFGNLNALADIATPDAAIAKKGKGKLKMFSAQTENAFLPGTLLGVNANSPHQADALGFLELVLSQEVQKNDFGDGMPVNAAAFEEQLKSPYSSMDDGMQIGMGSTDGEYYQLQVIWPTDAFMRTIADQIKALDTPCIPNQVVREMLITETQDYFTGAKTLDDTVKAFTQKLNLYLSE